MTKKKKGKVVQMLTPENYIRQKARFLPLFECFINSDWEENGMASITVARKHSNGNITMGMYLTDLKCLGVKDAYYFFNISEREYRDILKDMEEQMDIETVSYTLAHNIIFAGIEFADDYGFKPHKDFTSVAQYILEEDNEDVELIEIECGENGKPVYIRGPLENDARANKIIAQLEREAGPGNYDVIWQTEEDFSEDVWDEENEEDEDEVKDEEWDKLENKFKDFPIEEKIDLISDMVKHLTGLAPNEMNELDYLINSTVFSYVDFDLSDNLYNELTDKLNELEITEEFTDEILGIDPDSTIDRNKWEKKFSKLYKQVIVKPKSAKKEVNKLLKSMPGNPALAYLDLLLIQGQNDPLYEEKLVSYHKQFPDYPLIKIFWNTLHWFTNPQTDPLVIFKNSHKTFFTDKEKLHRIELFHYLFFLYATATKFANITLLDVVDMINDEFDFWMEDHFTLREMIKMSKLNFVLSLNEEENSAPLIKTGEEAQTYQFKIQINGITHPPVWRRIAVPSNYSFYDFHRIIQEAFGWWSSHFFQFSKNGFGSGQVITEIYEDVDADFEEQIDAKEIYLSDVFDKEKQKFVYIYDFGDSWEHTITLEKILPEKTITPELLAGKGQCPPEDCGGVWGYENFKEIMVDKKHPEYEEYAEWVGLGNDEEWNPAQFDLEKKQVILREMFRTK
ncbi:MAG: plasmid pRiA4b ORF-3 family protein [Mariniphaga sp.]|nr:plasmid pRiA4b ORF-3 family protein [Mariniphaga sp.]